MMQRRAIAAVSLAIAGCRLGFEPPGVRDAAQLKDAAPISDTLLDGVDGADAQLDAGNVCPVSFSFAYQSSRYRVAGLDNWTAAETDCAADGPGLHLVVFDGAAERDALVALASSTRTWIGISDRITAGSWLRVVGGGATYLPWASGAPTIGGAECVSWDPVTGTFLDEACTADHGRICECDGLAVDLTAF
jgi:hypothetical protein